MHVNAMVSAAANAAQECCPFEVVIFKAHWSRKTSAVVGRPPRLPCGPALPPPGHRADLHFLFVNSVEVLPSPASDECLWIVQQPVQIVRRADESQVGKRLREVPQVLAAWPEFFRVQSDVVRIPEHLFKHIPRLL